MTKDTTTPSSPIQTQFRAAARGLCRPLGMYDELKKITQPRVTSAPSTTNEGTRTPHQTHAPVAPQTANAPSCENVKRSDQLSDKKAKSYAQVALSVEQRVVRQVACGLKPEKTKGVRLGVRLSDAEREIVMRRAEAVRLSLSEYIRASALGAGYVSSVDPVRQKLLHDLSRELGRQGNNLNQIAHHLNAGISSTQQGEGMLAELYDSLIDAHNAVRCAMAEGKVYE